MTKIFGINGHPGMMDAYNNSPGGNPGVTYQKQIEHLKSMGLNWYRFGFTASPDGSLSSARHERMFGAPGEASGIVPLCKAAGINVLAVIGDRLYNDAQKDNISPLWTATNEVIYKAGFDIASGFAQRYGQYFTHYELGNEYELFRHLKVRDGNLGTQEDGYISMRHLEVVGWYVKGMDEGIKSVQPEAKTMFNTAGYSSWLEYDVVFSIATGVDIAAIHIYNDMLQGPVSSVIGPDYDFVGYLGNRFSRTVWVTETGYRWRSDKTQEENEQGQIDWHNTFVKTTTAEAVFWHELLSNPGVPKTLDEKNYGVIGFDNYETLGHSSPYMRPIGHMLIEEASTPPVVEEPDPTPEPEPPIEEPEQPAEEDVSMKVTGVSWSPEGGLILKFKKLV